MSQTSVERLEFQQIGMTFEIFENLTYTVFADALSDIENY